MPFPASWPPRPPSGLRSIRFFVEGTATAAFSDRAYMLLDAIQVLDYVAQAAAFTLGEVITGQVSGATAIVLSDANAGLTGTLTLRAVTGVFNPSEQLLGSVSGDATSNGVTRAPASTFTPLPAVDPAVPTVVPPTPYGSGAASGGSPAPEIWAQTFRICNDGGAALEYSFDGTSVQGKLLATEQVIFRVRHEAGIAVRGLGAAFRIEAW